MHDWKRIVKENLACVGLKKVPSEVAIELADHLEELYAEARSQGVQESVAFYRALQEVRDWRVLAREIRRTKSEEDGMNHRTRSLWIPGMVSLLGSNAALMLLQFVGFQPRLLWVGHLGMQFYWHWLAVLPLFGAVGAFLSRRARGSLRVRLAAGLSPALVLLATLCLILPWGLALDGLSFFRLVRFGIGVTNWVLLPALSLLIGVIPFLREPERVC